MDSAVIAGWNTGGAANPNHQDNQMYRDVFARACRTCHVAQKTFGATDTTLQFDTVADFKNLIGTVQTRVCHDKVMPHGKRSNQIFWKSLAPNMAGFLEIYGQPLTPAWQTDSVLQCGLFNSPNPGDVQSFFEGTVFPILHTASCANSQCHSAVGNAQFSITTAAATYTSLLTALSTSSAHYILANDLPGSLLYQKLLGNPVPQMPLGQLPITNRDTNGNGVFDADDIKNWITTFGAIGPSISGEGLRGPPQPAALRAPDWAPAGHSSPASSAHPAKAARDATQELPLPSNDLRNQWLQQSHRSAQFHPVGRA